MTLCPGRYRDVLPCHLLPPQPGHPGVTQGQCHELVQVIFLTSWSFVYFLVILVLIPSMSSNKWMHGSWRYCGMLVTICCCIDNRDKWPLNEETYCIADIRSSQSMPRITVSRVPMNVMTCGALLCLHVDYISQDKRLVFGACLGLCLIGTFWLELQMKVCETFTITEKALTSTWIACSHLTPSCWELIFPI